MLWLSFASWMKQRGIYISSALNSHCLKKKVDELCSVLVSLLWLIEQIVVC